MAASPLPYRPDIETPEADEEKTIQSIIEGMIGQSETVARREHHVVRASHAKPTALVTGTLEIVDGLPRELAQGLFATPGTRPVAVRMAQGPGERLGDRVSTHRGLSIKVFDVSGDKLVGHVTDTQDFVLASGPTFPSGTASGFLRDGTLIGKSAGLPEGAKSAVASAARNLNRILNTVGLDSAKADFFGHPFSHPLSEPYFSQAPLRFGDHVAKLAVFPATREMAALADWRLDPKEDEDGFRHATVAFFVRNEVVFEVRAQLWTDASTQPIEDASVEWAQDETPYVTVAVLRLPAQEAFSEARQRAFEEEMTFRPAHSLEAHRPLGSVMRARLKVYAALSAFRHRENAVPEEDPARIEDVPA